MPEHFCTYFDHRYAAKGLAMWRSLKAHRPDAVLHVLCLDQAGEAVLEALQLQDVTLHPLAALEGDDPDLAKTRGTRSLVEYYFTLTPCFPRYLLRTGVASTRLTYVDADLFFLSDPQPVFDELGTGSVAIIEHRFSPEIADHIVYGRFNVGWVTFCHDEAGLACLDLWREECLAWCHDRLDGDRFADQKYLDRWPERFPEVVVIQHPGANLAPWNLGRHTVSDASGVPMADGRPVIFYHAHGFEPAGPGRQRKLNLAAYGVTENDVLERTLFTPYARALQASTEALAVPLVLSVLSGHPREVPRQPEALAQALLAAGADRDYYLRELRASRAYIGTLEQRLEGLTEQQRAAVRVEQDTLHQRIADLDAALAAQRAELLAETFKVGALTTAAAADREALSMAEQHWAAARDESYALGSRLGALEARFDMEASARTALDARLAAAESARETLATALATSRAECQSLAAALDHERLELATLRSDREGVVVALAASRAEAQAMAAIAERERTARTGVESALTAAVAERADAVAALGASRADTEARSAMVADLQATIVRLASDLEAAGQRVGALTSQLNREERARIDALREVDAARGQVSARQSEMQGREEARIALERLTREVAQLTAERDEARTNWYHADGNLKVLKASLSWKVTGPLRVLRDALVGPAKHD